MKTLPIQNCNFEVDCPRQFDQLQATSEPNVHFCLTCSKQVYRCNSLQELANHSQAGHCVSLAVKPCDEHNTQERDVVRITSGTFENFDASIVSIDTQKQTAEIMVNIFGRVTPFWVPLETLAHADE